MESTSSLQFIWIEFVFWASKNFRSKASKIVVCTDSSLALGEVFADFSRSLYKLQLKSAQTTAEVSRKYYVLTNLSTRTYENKTYVFTLIFGLIFGVHIIEWYSFIAQDVSSGLVVINTFIWYAYPALLFIGRLGGVLCTTFVAIK